MSWIHRLITDHILQTMSSFPAVLLTGPRQVGKSSLLQRIGEDYEYISFDNPFLLQQALEDPALFFLNHPGKLILDEIQYAPSLFPYLKMRIDEVVHRNLLENRDTECLFLQSGSQAFHLMQNVSESLAGRLAVIPLQGISYREQAKIKCTLPFVPNEEYLKIREKEANRISNLWEMIHRGSMPRLISTEIDWDLFYAGYVTTYIERDVNQLTKVQDRESFIRFMAAVAARSGELLSYENIGKESGVSAQTARRWIQILETAGIILLLYPYSNNHLKRVLKTPKLYFLDTGLMAWLTRWLTPETMQRGAKSGQFFETWVVGEIVKSYLNAGKSTRHLYYYRDADQREIDLIIESGRTVYPVEIKHTAKPDRKMTAAFSQLVPITKAGDLTLGDGAIINRYPDVLFVDDRVRAIPVEYL